MGGLRCTQISNAWVVLRLHCSHKCRCFIAKAHGQSDRLKAAMSCTHFPQEKETGARRMGLGHGLHREGPRALLALQKSPAPPGPGGERATALSLPRSDGATQSGAAITARAVQFPLSIIHRPRGAARRGPGGRGLHTGSGHRGRPRLSRRAMPGPGPGAVAVVVAVAVAGLGQSRPEPCARCPPAAGRRCSVTCGAH